MVNWCHDELNDIHKIFCKYFWIKLAFPLPKMSVSFRPVCMYRLIFWNGFLRAACGARVTARDISANQSATCSVEGFRSCCSKCTSQSLILRPLPRPITVWTAYAELWGSGQRSVSYMHQMSEDIVEMFLSADSEWELPRSSLFIGKWDYLTNSTNAVCVNLRWTVLKRKCQKTTQEIWIRFLIWCTDGRRLLFIAGITE